MKNPLAYLATFLFTSEAKKAVDRGENTIRCIFKSYEEGGWDFSHVRDVYVCLSFETENVGIFRIGHFCFQGCYSGA